MRKAQSGRAVPRAGGSVCRLAFVILVVLACLPGSGAARTLTQAERDHWSADPRLDISLASWLRRGYPDADAVAATAARSPDATSPADLVPVVIEGDVRPDDLAAAGVQVQTQAGGVTTALLPVDALADLLAAPGVTGVRSPAALLKQLNISALAIGAPVLWNGTPPVYFGLTGKGVVVGIIDTGIDLKHKDFRTTANKTRVKFLWDQTAVGAGIPGFSYGIEYTASQIDAGTVTTTDDDGHGTHIASVAAGNGQATGNGYPAWRYVGIAPEADLIIVKSRLIESQIIDGASYIFQRAATLGEKAVVLIAAGTERGAHDGSYSMEQALSAMTGQGKLIVASVGNNNTLPYHASMNLTSSGASGYTTLTVPIYTPNVSVSEKFELSGWHEATAAFDVKLTSPSGYTTGWISPGVQSTRLRTRDGAFAIWNDVRTTAKGGKEIYIYCLDDSANIGPKPGTWRIDLLRRASTTTGRLDFWLFDWLWAGFEIPKFISNVDPTMLVTTPACGDSVIGIGAFTSRVSWPGTNGLPVTLTEPATLGAICSFSSPGPRRDGVARPDVAAPGQMVAAALSAPVSARLGTSGYKVDDGVHWVAEGTSVAAAHAAGGLALFLQQQPTLTPSGARALLHTRARKDSFTGLLTTPSIYWGYGKLGLAPVATAAEPMARTLSLAAPIPNPVRNGAVFQYVLGSDDVAGVQTVELRIIDISGREVARIAAPAVAGAHSVTWSGTTTDGRSAPAGIYLARLQVGARSNVRKFVRLD